MQKDLKNIWNRISTLGITSQSSPSEVRLIKTLNRLSLIAALAVLPFVFPDLNPTYDTFGWIEFVSGLGFLSILGANALQKNQTAAFLLVLTANFKIFFSASARGWEAGEQLFFIPLFVGLLLLYDIKKQKIAWVAWLLTLAVFTSLEITSYNLLMPDMGYPESVVKEIFTLNFIICAFIILATTYYYSRLATQQQEEILTSRAQVINASKVKSEFLSVISHELITPLHAILNYSEMLAETGLNPEQDELNNGLRLSGKNLSVIVSHILSISRLGDDNDPLDLKVFEPTAPLQETAEIYQSQAELKMLKIQIRPSQTKENVMLKADEGRILQMLGFLVDNAIKFSNAGLISLSAETILEKGGKKGQLIYKIEDQGNGISETDLSQIFMPFFMNDSSRNRVNGGLGLGLTICKRLIDSMDGEIHIQSKINKGSAFIVRIPVEVTAQRNNHIISMPEQHKDSCNIEAVNILLVDDHPVNQKVASTMLKKLGYTYQLAANGQEAVAAAESGEFHLVFMDIQMPVMDGIEATRRIRVGLPQEIQPIIIALTANTTEGDREACFEAGMNDFLTKPITKSSIEKSIDKWKPEIPTLA